MYSIWALLLKPIAARWRGLGIASSGSCGARASRVDNAGAGPYLRRGPAGSLQALSARGFSPLSCHEMMLVSTELALLADDG
jgi:hypothetical protein